jgi:hypothetical protein
LFPVGTPAAALSVAGVFLWGFPVSYYFDESDLIHAVTVAGVLTLADRDNDGQLTDAEKDQYLTPAKVWACADVDFYISEVCEPSHARASGNEWLKLQALCFGVFHFCCVGGNNPPESVILRRDAAKEYLQRIKEGDRIPGLVYPESARSSVSTRFTRIRNVT